MYRVGIIGLGSIAARYSTPDDAYPYCHTGGIRFCETTELVAVADMSQERQTEFSTGVGDLLSQPILLTTTKQMCRCLKVRI